MYKLNFKKIAKFEEKYRDSALVMNILSQSIDIFIQPDVTLPGTNVSVTNITTLLDLGLIKEVKEKKEVKKSSKK